MRLICGIVCSLVVAAGVFTAGIHLTAQSADVSRQWAQWRGPDATGVSPTANPPLEWSETQERPVEGRDPRPRLRVAGGLGRPGVRADRRAGRGVAATRSTRRAAV